MEKSAHKEDLINSVDMMFAHCLRLIKKYLEENGESSSTFCQCWELFLSLTFWSVLVAVF